jgi:hypothetical protein
MAPQYEGSFARFCGTPAPTRVASVRVSDGAADVEVTVYAEPPSQLPVTSRLHYTSRLLHDGQLTIYDAGCGPNWISSLTPYLHEDGDLVAVVFSLNVAYWFDIVDGEYRARFGAKQVLTHDAASHTYSLAMPDGTIWKFHDFAQVGAQRGALKSMRNTNGDLMTVTSYTVAGHVAVIEKSYVGDHEGADVMIHDRAYLSYAATGPDGAEQIELIRWARQIASGSETTTREQRHTYYGAGELHGNQGDLKTVTLLEPDGTSMSVVATHYMRYYRDDASGTGFRHGLKYYLSPAAVDLLESDPQFDGFDAADDTLIADYADSHFEYAAQQRVSKSVIDAGDAEYGFVVAESDNPDGYNSWRTKTTVTPPGGVATVYFSNHIQQEMLSDTGNGSSVHCRSYIEGTAPNQGCCAALEALHAHPEAVRNYDENAADLDVELYAMRGLIEARTYYDDNGQAPGYLHRLTHKTGTAGSEVVQEQWGYTTQVINGVTVYVPYPISP